MTAAAPRSTRRLRGITVMLVVGTLLLSALPTAFAGEAVSDATKDRLATALSVHGGGGDAATSESSSDDDVSAAQEGDERRCFRDAGGDTRRLSDGAPAASPEADITRHCVSFAQELKLELRVANPTNPLEDNAWQQGTFLAWFIETSGDQDADFYVEYHLGGDGKLFAQMSDIRDEQPSVVCNATATYSDDTYSVSGLPVACVDGATRVRVNPGMFYQPGNDNVFYDTAPNGRAFETAVSRAEACPNPDNAPFEDRNKIAPTHRPNVDCLYELGVALGTIRNGDRFFEPKKDITRGQFAGFLFRALEFLDYEIPQRSGTRFEDVPASHTFDEEIHRLATAGIITGFGDGTYRPGNTIKRDQTATLLAHAMEKVSGDVVVPQAPGEHFRDTDGNIHEENIDAAFELDLVSGVEAPTENRQGLYAPRGRTDRQRMASVLRRFIDAAL